uniref:protein SOB FIVE-LIKE 5-like n=1 Tax=Erigeron canadensis TaxID=72917 RepID=UPI001CB945EF|nr:protein SOB FIVE-LIKE 5-like [Erigeron canadensis]
MEENYGSECISGCESGWTLYLEHSILYPTQSFENHNNTNGDDFIYKKSSFSYEYDDEEEDMSMVSDASSGPPHFQEQEEEQECFNKIITNGKRQKIPKEPSLCRKVQDLPSFLDDTASSPLFNISNNNLTVGNKNASLEENDIIDYSQGYSTTYYEGKPAYQDQFGFFHPSVSGTQLQQNQWFEEKRWGV